MVCTFGDLADVTWWRELRLPTRVVIGRDGRLLPEPPAGVDPASRTPSSPACTVNAARRRDRRAARRRPRDLIGEPRPITHPVKFYERGDSPLEIVSTRQWYLRNGGRDADLRGGCSPGAASCAGCRRTCGTATSTGWAASPATGWSAGSASSACRSRSGTRSTTHGEPDYAQPLVPAEVRAAGRPVVRRAGRLRPRRSAACRAGSPATRTCMDTWATSSLTPQIVGGWETDPDLFARVFPMDLRPQAHEIIRTWLFSTVVRAHLEHGVLPWRDAVISGWILDPDRKKMSKSKGNVVTPMALLAENGSDAVRYWAASGRPGTDLAFDPGADPDRPAAGHQAAQRVEVRARPRAPPTRSDHRVTEPLDRAMLAGLRDVVATATAGLRGLRPHRRAAGHRVVLLDVLRRLHRAGQGAGLRRAAGRRLGPGGAGHRAVRPAAAVRAVPAVRDRGGLVVVAVRLGAPLAVADRRTRSAGRRRRRPGCS